jgi:hypothetical protein
LAGVHAAAQLVAGCPDRGIEAGFFDGHSEIQFIFWICSGEQATSLA